MSHYSVIEWVDFARGYFPPAKGDQMTASAEGCAECQTSFNLWTHVHESLLRDKAYQPANVVVRAAKDLFPEDRFIGWLLRVAQYANVVFDSLLQPALAGTRSSFKRNRQLTVESGPFVVDLQLESDFAQQQFLITGQILANSTSSAKIAGAEIVLLSPDRIVQKTTANDLGEFQMDSAQTDNLRLFIDIKGERAVGIVLPNVENPVSERPQ